MVRIDDARLHSLAAELAAELEAERRGERSPEQLSPPTADPTTADVEVIVRHVIALDAINFGSGYHDVVDKDPGLSGARTMAVRLTNALDALPSEPSLDWFQALTPAACADIFGQSLEHPDQAELMALFAAALNQLGHFVADSFDGAFTNFVAAADHSAQTLTDLLLAMPFYQDRAVVPGESADAGSEDEVHFYKRAQITAADLARAFNNQAPTAFTDLDRLTAFADNLVPHVLRVDGALQVDGAVAATIDRGEQLVAGGRAELELRAAGVEAVERLVALIDDPKVRAMDLDLALWSRGGGPRYKAQARHRTRCTFY